MFRIRIKILFHSALILLGLAAAFPGTPLRAQEPEAPPGELFQVKSEFVEGKTRVVLKVRHPVKQSVFSLTNPDRIVINLTPCLLKVHPVPELKTGPINRLRCSQFNENTVRLVLDLKRKAAFSVSTPEGDPFQRWIELEDTPKKTESPAPAQISKKAGPSTRKAVPEDRESLRTVKKTPPPPSREKKPGPSVAPNPNPEGGLPEPLLETGRALLGQKQYAQGREAFFRYLNLAPAEELDLRVVEEIYRSYLLEGKALQGEKARRQIIQAFSQAHGSSARPALIRLADYYVETGQHSLALPLINQLKSDSQGKSKELLQSRFQSALLPELEGLFNRGYYKEVIRLFYQDHENLQDSPDPRFSVLLGKSFKALGLTDPALRYFQEAWQRGAQDPQEMHLDWAEVLIEKGDQTSAFPLLRKLIDHPTLPDQLKQRAYLLLGQGWYQQRHYAEALKILEESLARFPSAEACPERWYLLGALYAENPGLNAKALAALRLFVGRSQNSSKTAAAYERIGDLYFSEGKVSEAREAFQQAQQFNRRPTSSFLAQKIIHCRLLLEPKAPGSNAANSSAETDPFWTKVYESRAGQKTLDKKISDLRFN